MLRNDNYIVRAVAPNFFSGKDAWASPKSCNIIFHHSKSEFSEEQLWKKIIRMLNFHFV